MKISKRSLKVQEDSSLNFALKKKTLGVASEAVISILPQQYEQYNAHAVLYHMGTHVRSVKLTCLHHWEM